jgi:hypothetical protein
VVLRYLELLTVYDLSTGNWNASALGSQFGKIEVGHNKAEAWHTGMKIFRY